MGWFVIACIIGFLGYWGWQSQSKPVAATIITAMTLVLGLVLWPILDERARTVGDILDDLSDGRVGRFMLGIVLGAGSAFFMAKGLLFQRVSDGEREQPSNVLAVILLSLAFGIMFLALLAPHVDRWLSNATTIKSPYLELQLAPLATHKVSVTEGSEKLSESDSLRLLIEYDDKIHADITYMKNYPNNVTNESEVLKSADNLDKAFHFIKSAALCVQMALKQKWLSTESARQMVRPTAALFEEIVFGGEDIAQDGLNEKFWESIKGLRENILKQLKKGEAKPTEQEQSPKKCQDALNHQGKWPEIRNRSQKNPYLFVAGALLNGMLI